MAASTSIQDDARAQHHQQHTTSVSSTHRLDTEHLSAKDSKPPFLDQISHTTPPPSISSASFPSAPLPASTHYIDDEKHNKPTPSAVSIDISKLSRIDRWRMKRQNERQRMSRMMSRFSGVVMCLEEVGNRIAWVVEAIDNPHFIVVVYFLLNLSMTMYNKVIMKLFHFNFPWLLTAIHTFLSCIGSIIFLSLVPTSKQTYDPISTSTPSSTTVSLPTSTVKGPKRHDVITILMFSVLYTVNIAVSNVSLNMVSLPFHQVVRSTNPAVTLALESVFFGKKIANQNVYLSLMMVIAGVALATLGEYEFSIPGLLMTLLGVLLSSLKGICTNRLLVGTLHFHPLDLLRRMSGLATLQCLLVAWWSGELSAFQRFISPMMVTIGLRSVHCGVDGGVVGEWGLAFFLNLVSFMANRRVGALSMTVAGNVKQSMTIALSVWVFGYIITVPPNGLGILLTLIGGAWYR
ncbi:hypothetical protein BC829DRAFT_407495 [Chytridium lagenaria]|nr:hypothetical protein BC829DRAFT_407495 [Chytridium lagenaria]